MEKITLDTRMKQYEWSFKTVLPQRLPVIIRADGKAFHTVTRKAKCEKPFDTDLHKAMVDATTFLCNNAQGVVLGYTQSDEISILLINYKNLDSDSWFDNEVQKMVSIVASAVTWAFTVRYKKFELPTMFDARAFVLPREEVCNYFVWRNQDAIRNSVAMLAQSQFSHKQLQGKKSWEMKKMLLEEKGISWDEMETWKRHGSAVFREMYEKEGVPRHRWVEDVNTPIFKDDRNYIEKYVFLDVDNRTLTGHPEGDIV